MRIKLDGVEGELVMPDTKEKTGGVVLVQEYWGLNDHVRDIAKRLAAQGFRVFAVDLYHGKVTSKPEEARELMGSLDWPKALGEIIAAATHLRDHETSNGKVAVMGFCMGGALTFAAAANIPWLAAGVPFYGVPDEKLADYTKEKAPILAHFATNDQWASVDKGKAIQAKVPAMELHVYEAGHAFFNDTRPEVYSPNDAKTAWERSIAFLKTHLS